MMFEEIILFLFYICDLPGWGIPAAGHKEMAEAAPALFPAAGIVWPVNNWASPTPGSTDGAPVLLVSFCGIQIGYALRKTNLEGSRDDGT